MHVSVTHCGRRLVHKYRVYRDPWPHPALRNGRITKLVSLVNRAMVIAKLTQLRIAIPLSGHVPGKVPIDCFPKVDDRDVTKSTKRVSFAQGDQPSKVPIDHPISVTCALLRLYLSTSSHAKHRSPTTPQIDALTRRRHPRLPLHINEMS